MTTVEPRSDAPRPAVPDATLANLPQADESHWLTAPFAELGAIFLFAVTVIKQLPDVRKYTTEVIHQAGILILSSGLIIWVMEAALGTTCGLEASYSLKQIGAPLYSGVFDAWCALRELAPYMWGYIFAAKIGCGLVAEFGSMRIADEVDALEVMGIPPLTYLVGARVLAVWLAVPFLFTVGLGSMYIAEYLVTVVDLQGISSGGYLYIFWLYQNPADFLYSLCKAGAMATVITFVSCYYGYTARGGSVGVGKNTAKSMMVNLTLVHIIGLVGTQLFWGLAPNAPIAN
jgi:phospholipid/cholesterol/gamma-HCH transport system permease protein